MSNLLLLLCIILFLIVIAIFCFVCFFVRKLKNSIGEDNFNSLANVITNAGDIAKEESMREKSVVGMTNLVLPLVVQDIPDFDVNMIYNTIESNLNKIFSCLENKKYVKDDDLILLQEAINSKIDDLKESNSSVSYDEVVFHKHALKRYEKKNGVATLTTSTSLEYYFHDGKEREDTDLKRQTRYTCTFVYIFDYTKIKNKNREKLFVLHCPNCNAPLDDFSSGKCRYCMSSVGDTFAKCWKMVSYKEDYN